MELARGSRYAMKNRGQTERRGPDALPFFIEIIMDGMFIEGHFIEAE